MIPENINQNHILKAIREIDMNGVPKGRKSRKFQLFYNGKHYPPKYVISLANKYANGMELEPSEFSGGQETNNFLKKLGFEVVELPPSRMFPKPSPAPRKISERKGLRHDERCLESKKTIETMLRKIYGTVEVNYKFEAGTKPEDYRHSPFYSKLKEIFSELQNHRGYKDFVRSQTLPRCDFFVPNPGFIVEFDESQHFTACRKIALSKYPEHLKLGFDREKWIKHCEKIDAKDNDPPYRDEQRAWYDTLRDFIPTIKGLQPTIRIFSRDFRWCSLNPEKPSDVEKFKSIITISQKRVDGLNPMKVVLYVPIINQSTKKRDYWENEVAKYAKDVDAELIVFPEGYISCKFDDAVSKVRKLAEKIGFAVLCGVSIEGYEGYQLAVFWNPKPKTGETKKHHLYIKHSTAGRLAYEWPEYKGKDDPMFDPIIFRGRKIGVMICHDMFFPLITDTLVRHGAEILVDLTGGNVNLRKWSNIIQARSLEIRGAFLCTMGHDPTAKGEKGNPSGHSSYIVYENGRKVLFEHKPLRGHVDRPVFEMVTVPCSNAIPEDKEQPFSNMSYSDITISFEKGRKADLEIIKINGNVKVSHYGKDLNHDTDGWIKTRKGDKIIGLLVLPLKDMLDRTSIFKRKPQNVDFHFVLYYGKKSTLLTNSDLIALAKLRAIENRVGILILTDEMREAFKTTNRKNIQRLKEKNGVFGFNRTSICGLESVFSRSETDGIPEKFKHKYLELLP